jgi:hypothetical protein
MIQTSHKVSNKSETFYDVLEIENLINIQKIYKSDLFDFF